MKRTAIEARQQAASALFVLAWTFWFHRWAPAAAVVILVVWVILHHRLEAGLADVLAVRWRRAWRSRLLAITLLTASALVFAAADAVVETKVLPITLDAVALSVILWGPWWGRVSVPRWMGGDMRAPHVQLP